MKKLQVLQQNQEPVKGYDTVLVDRNNIDLSQVTDNECDSILASDVMDSFTAPAAAQLIQALSTKLRLNGELVIGGTDVRLFAKAVSNGLIAPVDASNIVTNVHSMTTSEQVREICTQLGLQIQSVHLDGLHYEVKVKRGQ
jgi:hypothetical protein